MIDQWVERHVVLDGGIYEDQEATATFALGYDDTLHLFSIEVDGCVFQVDVIERQIGEDAIKRIVKHVRDWWDYEGYDNWIDSIEADRADARYKRERDYA
jgi:hypothetical protein